MPRSISRCSTKIHYPYLEIVHLFLLRVMNLENVSCITRIYPCFKKAHIQRKYSSYNTKVFEFIKLKKSRAISEKFRAISRIFFRIFLCMCQFSFLTAVRKSLGDKVVVNESQDCKFESCPCSYF